MFPLLEGKPRAQARLLADTAAADRRMRPPSAEEQYIMAGQPQMVEIPADARMGRGYQAPADTVEWQRPLGADDMRALEAGDMKRMPSSVDALSEEKLREKAATMPKYAEGMTRYFPHYQMDSLDHAKRSLSLVPLGGLVRAPLENLGVGRGNALTAERVAAAGVGGVGALTMLSAIHGLMNPQTPGTIIIQ